MTALKLRRGAANPGAQLQVLLCRLKEYLSVRLNSVLSFWNNESRAACSPRRQVPRDIAIERYVVAVFLLSKIRAR